MHSDELLVQHAWNGDEDAFAALFKLHFKMVKSAAYRIVRDEYTAQDIAQEVFMKAYNKIGTLVDFNKVESWLYTMTKRKAIDWLRYQKRQPTMLHDQMEIHADSFLLEDNYINKELSMLLQDALLHLDHPHRAAIVLHELRGFTAKEISTMTQVSTNTIESRIRRARQKLKKELANHTVDRISIPVNKPWIVQQPAKLLHNWELEKHLINHSILAVMLHMRRIAG